jgi:integrase/recombinase XerD
MLRQSGEEGAKLRMTGDDQNLIVLTPFELALPPLIAAAGKHASRRFVEFFTANIRNPNTREAYSRNINAFLARR